jgi:hypothetical protein
MKYPNEFTIDGTLYHKETRTVVGKKDPTKNYDFNSYVLEIDSPMTWQKDGREITTVKKELVKFALPFGFPPETFSIGDFVQVRFKLTGREFDKRDGTGKGYSTEPQATYIKHGDLDANDARPVAQVAKEKTKEENVFIPPDPKGEWDDTSDLPF